MDVVRPASKMTTHLAYLVFFFAVLQCRTANSDQVLFTCGFEDSCVDDIVQETRNDEIDFEVASGWQGDWYTGPEADHSGIGNYFFINANGDNVIQGDRAVIDLPFPDQHRFRAGYAELSLAYHMYTSYGARDQMGTLNVYVDCGGDRNITWFVDGNQGDKWKTATIPLECESEPVEVSIEAVRKGVQSDIAIDDIRFVDIFEGEPLMPTTRSIHSNVPSSSQSTPSPSRGILPGTTLLTKPGRGSTSVRTELPGGTGSITPPPMGNPTSGLGLDVIVPIAAAALVALILIIILVLVLLIHRQRKSQRSADVMEPPSQLYENNIYPEPSPDRKYESLQGPLSNNRIYEELNHEKKPYQVRPNGTHTHRPPYTAARMNGQVPPAVRRSMPELGDNYYDRINDRINERVNERVVDPVAVNNATTTRVARTENNRNNLIAGSQTYHPGRTSYPEDHPYFTLMPDVVSSTAFPDDRILFNVPPPPQTTPPPLPPLPRDYDYGRRMLAEEDVSDMNEYHDVPDVDKRRPLSLNSEFEDDEDFGRQRLAVDMMNDGGFELGSELRLSRDTDISDRLDFDLDADMRMSADGEVDIHNMDTLEMQPRRYDRDHRGGRDRRSRDLELERNLDYPARYGSSHGSIDRRRNHYAMEHGRADDELKDYPSQSSYYHMEDDGHIRMDSLNYPPSVSHV